MTKHLLCKCEALGSNTTHTPQKRERMSLVREQNVVVTRVWGQDEERKWGEETK
jgi:hypothetical protein